MEFERNSSNRQKLNITPLIDLVFLLLIFFMLTTSFSANQGIELNFGGTAKTGAGGKNDIVSIVIEGEGIVLFEDKKLAYSEISGAIGNILKDDRTRQIIISSTDKANVQDIVSVLDEARIAGATNVTLVENVR